MAIYNRKARKTAQAITPDLASDYTSEEITVLASLGELVEIPSGQTIMDQGASGDDAYLIAQGQAHVERDGVVLASIGPSELVGEQALITGEARNATVTASSTVRALRFGKREFSWLRFESPKLRRLGDELVASRS